MGRSHSRPHTRFAAISLFIVALMTLAAALAGVRLVSTGQQGFAARDAAHLVGEPVRGLFASTDPSGLPEARDAADEIVGPLMGGGNLRSVRVWSPDGVLVYQSGEAPQGALQPAAISNIQDWRGTAADGSSLFLTYAEQDGYVIELAQPASRFDTALDVSRVQMLFAVIVCGIAIWALLQGAFWFGVRTLKQAHGRLRYLYDTGEQLRSSLDLHDVLARLVRDATAFSGATYGLVALVDDTTGDLMMKTTHDQTTGETGEHQRALDEWFVRRCVATNQTVVSTINASTYKHLMMLDRDVEGSATQLTVPLSVRDRVVGAVAVIKPSVDGKDANFNESQVRLVEALGAQAVTAVEQAVLFAKVRTDANEVQESYDSTLKALMAALDAKDEVTEGHCERVAKLTVELAKDMDIPANMLIHIERGALLHDVGKIGVPDAILKKPKALNDMEWEAMRKHPLLAGVMVSKVGFLEAAMPILLYHHERYDGGGYPFGLSEDRIPLEARIFMIIDAYDAMTSHRPYRPAMTHQQAMDEIREHSGTQFDPVCAEAFARMMTLRPELRQQVGHRIAGSHDEEEDDIAAA